MRTYMARLGDFMFGIETAAFRELQRASTYSWKAQERIGREPAQQNIGRGAETIGLSGVIYPHYRGGLGQVEELRAMARTGLPQPLIYASEQVGQYMGRWCITAIEETRTVFFEDGTPRRIEFKISLVEYGEDAP
jgi:phage protein U